MWNLVPQGLPHLHFSAMWDWLPLHVSKPPVLSLLDLTRLFGRYRSAKSSLHHDTSFSLAFHGATLFLFSSTHKAFLKVLAPGLHPSSDTFSNSLHPSLWFQGQPGASCWWLSPSFISSDLYVHRPTGHPYMDSSEAQLIRNVFRSFDCITYVCPWLTLQHI